MGAEADSSARRDKNNEKETTNRAKKQQPKTDKNSWLVLYITYTKKCIFVPCGKGVHCGLVKNTDTNTETPCPQNLMADIPAGCNVGKIDAQTPNHLHSHFCEVSLSHIG